MTIMRNRHTSVWSKAAKLIAEGKNHSILSIIFILHTSDQEKFTENFSHFVQYFGSLTIFENQLAQTLALLFMEQIERDEK